MSATGKPRWWIEHSEAAGDWSAVTVMRVEWTEDGQLFAAVRPITPEMAEDTSMHPRLAAAIANLTT